MITTQKPIHHSVYDSDTNDYLGEASEELARESAETNEGHCLACYDETSETWQYVADCDAEAFRARGEIVQRVYCAE